MPLSVDFVKSIFSKADAFDATGFASHFAEDGVFIFGINPQLQGRTPIAQANKAFFSQLAKMRHEFKNIWINGNTSIAEATAFYTRKDGKQVNLPVVTIFEFEEELIKQDRIYMDMSALFQ